MSNTPFIQLYVADYLGDTQHLTTEQHGAYLLILMTMWRNGGVLPNDKSKLARIARVTPKRWHLICDDVMEFFDIEDGNITQKRLVEEYQKAVSKSEKRKTSGSLGGKAKSLKNKDHHLANASNLPKHLSEPDTRIEKRDTSVSPKKGTRLPANFIPDFQIAFEKGFSQSEADELFAGFKDYWISQSGQKGVKLDWQATWRNWVRSPYNQKFKAGQNHANTSKKPFAERVTDEMQNFADRYGFNEARGSDDRWLAEIFPSGEKADQRANGQSSADGRSDKTITLIASNG